MNYNLIAQIDTNKHAYRVIEVEDADWLYENLAGDAFNPRVNTDISPEELARQEQEFIDLINNEGVYGYVLERWNPSPDKGWEHVDSCWGFVGRYSFSEPKFKHYIVDELIQAAMKGEVA